MSEEVIVLTAEGAIKRLPKKDEIHTFLNSAIGFLAGADWSRCQVIELLQSTEEIQVSGTFAQGMGHGIAAKRGNEWVFIETENTTENNDQEL